MIHVLTSPYTGPKFALDGFFSVLREELAQAKSNVTVTLAVLGLISKNTVVRGIHALLVLVLELLGILNLVNWHFLSPIFQWKNSD